MKESVFGLFIFILVSIVYSSPVLPKEYESVISIDLGTTYSRVGVFINGEVEILKNEQGHHITPSYVAFTKNERLIGDLAKDQATINPENTIFNFKRLIGRSFDDEEVQRDIKLLPYKVVSKYNKPYIVVKVKGEEKEFSPEEISAMILDKMKEIAEVRLGKNVTHAVITCPAYFNYAQRAATKEAGVIAGLEVLRVINEPTAAAVAYGFKKDEGKEHNVLVYHLGGGTFDVSMVSFKGGVYEILATNGDTHLGGEDFNQNIMEYLLKIFKKKTGKDASQDKKALQKLRKASETAKRILSTSPQTIIKIENLFDGTDFKEVITRERFEDLNMHLFRKTLVLVKKVIKDSKFKKSNIDEIVLVGGSTRIPKIQQLLKNFFGGKEPNHLVHPDEAVAYGAAIQGGIFSKEESTHDVVLLDVAPLTLGIETVGGVMTSIISHGSRIPNENSQIFSTYHDDQDGVSILIYEGEGSMTKDNNLLGKIDLTGIPPAKRGVPQIEVTFKVDVNGLLRVSAKDKASNLIKSITISNDHLKQANSRRKVKEFFYQSLRLKLNYSIIKPIIMDCFEYNILLEIRSQMNYVRDEKNKRVIEFEDGLEMTIFKNYNISCQDIEVTIVSTADEIGFEKPTNQIKKSPKYIFPFVYQILFKNKISNKTI
ncbi:hypothetical protein RB653_005978 [Dictyostelium firmibasis]|uniref:Uncharacterized protein n=1 Tax=Dictyostelium firmibasis TaxID=79012 RepID=A0AAN7U8N2_9MYCE